jgi:hypothetical protein
MQITEKTTAEDIQKFMRRHGLGECYEAAGFLFRVKVHAEAYNKQKNDDGLKIHVKGEEESKDRWQKGKTELSNIKE